LIKTDSLGNTLWNKSYGGPKTDYGRSVEQTFDGGYIISGNTYSFSAGDADVGLLKTDSEGNLQWIKNFGGTKRDRGECVYQTSDGGFIITGYTDSYGAGFDDVWILKTDSNGFMEWSKTVGGPKHDRGYSIRQTKDGGYIIVGETLSYGAGSMDVYLIKLEADYTDVNDKTVIEDYKLHQNYPKEELVSLKIYNVIGQEVIKLINEEKSAGNYEVEFNAASLSSGVYFYQLKSEDFLKTKKMILLK
jgi:hypothetical protein